MKVYLQKKMTTCMTTCLNMVFDDAAGTNDGPDSDCENGEERSRRALPSDSNIDDVMYGACYHTIGNALLIFAGITPICLAADGDWQ